MCHPCEASDDDPVRLRGELRDLVLRERDLERRRQELRVDLLDRDDERRDDRHDGGPHEEHPEDADGAELAEAAEGRDGERAVRDARDARAHELGPERVLHGLEARDRGWHALLELAVPREQHDRVVDAVADDDGPEERPRRVHVAEVERGERVSSADADGDRKEHDHQRHDRAEVDDDADRDAHERGDRGPDGLVDDGLLFGLGVRYVPREADHHLRVVALLFGLGVVGTQAIDEGLHPHRERIAARLAHALRARDDAEDEGLAVLAREVSRRKVVVFLRRGFPAVVHLVEPEGRLLLALRGPAVAGRATVPGGGCGRGRGNGGSARVSLRSDLGDLGSGRSARFSGSRVPQGAGVFVVEEVLDEARAEGDLAVDGAVGVLEVFFGGEEPLVGAVEGLDLLRSVLEVLDEVHPARATAPLVAVARRLAGLVLFYVGVEARRDVVDEALVGGSVGRLDDEDERRTTADTPELVLVGLEPRAIFRQELGEVASNLERRLRVAEARGGEHDRQEKDGVEPALGEAHEALEGALKKLFHGSSRRTLGFPGDLNQIGHATRSRQRASSAASSRRKRCARRAASP